MSEKTKTENFIDYFQNLDQALKNGTVECIIKINNHLYPESLSTTMAPCICELSKKEIILHSRNALSLTWKKDIKVVTKIDYIDISNVKLSILKRLNGILGIFPTYFLSLKMDIQMKNNEVYSLECNSFEEIPDMIKLFISNNIKLIDPFNLQKLYSEKTSSEVTEYLHKNYDKLA